MKYNPFTNVQWNHHIQTQREAFMHHIPKDNTKINVSLNNNMPVCAGYNSCHIWTLLLKIRFSAGQSWPRWFDFSLRETIIIIPVRLLPLCSIYIFHKTGHYNFSQQKVDKEPLNVFSLLGVRCRNDTTQCQRGAQARRCLCKCCSG